MAAAKKCDRCGIYYNSYNIANSKKNINGFLTVNIDNQQKYFLQELIDLCPDCMAQLKKWLLKEAEFNENTPVKEQKEKNIRKDN